MTYLVAVLWLWVLTHVRAVSGALPRPAAPIARTLGWTPVALGLLVLVLVGCPGPAVIREPALPPPPEGCVAGATVCHQGAPWRCGPGGHWSQADRRCDRLGTEATPVLCCLTPSALRPGVNVHACVPSNACAPEVTP